MESRNSGHSLRTGFPKNLGHAVAHFFSGFVGEGYRKNRLRIDAMGANQVAHAMGNHPGFATASAGQNQKRAFYVCCRFPLLGVKTLQKVHGMKEILILTQGLLRRGVKIITLLIVINYLSLR